MAEAIEKRIRISKTLGVVMGGVAFGIDFVQGLLTTGFIGIAVNTFISIFAVLMFWFWFKLNGITFLESGARMAITFFGGAFIELIPIINNFPAWTLSVVIMLFIVRAEDMVYNKTGKDMKMIKALKSKNLARVSAKVARKAILKV